MFEPMGTMLNRARDENYAVLAVSAVNLEQVRAIIDAAVEDRAPIIIDLYQAHLRKHIPVRHLLPAVRDLAQSVPIPVALNLDHGDDPVFVKKCIFDGLTSVMMDASKRPFEENVQLLREIVEFARPRGVCVEGELGGMGSAATDEFTTSDMFTDPQQAAELVEATGVDVLAVSFGSTHGLFPAGYTPALHFDVLDRIRKAVAVPLVLHGSSGCGMDNIHESVLRGINKVNMGTDFMRTFVTASARHATENPDVEYPDFLGLVMTDAKKVVHDYIAVTDSAGRV